MEAFAGHLLLLSGSPGSGKTTTAESLARQPGIAKVHLHTDDFWGYIKQGHIEPWLPQAAAQNAMIMEIAASVARQYAQHGYFVALDGVIGPWSLAPYRDLGVPTHYIVLRTGVDEAVRRCEGRGADSLTDPSVVALVHAMFDDLGPYQRHVLEVSGLDRRTTLETVADALESGDYRLSDIKP